MAFMVALVPPQKTGVLKYGDTAGNLNAAEAWEIPMAEGARSSLIRREMDKAEHGDDGHSRQRLDHGICHLARLRTGDLVW